MSFRVDFQFDDADAIPYRPGSLFLGYSDKGREVGVKSERHFLTISGSGTGKGAALIVPNLLRWRDNVICIDVGGGNARATWEAREAMGQTVAIFDPARVSLIADKNHPGVPERLLKSFNPLDRLDPSSRTYGEDLGVLADGLVLRHDPKHARWDNAGLRIIAGLIDFLVSYGPPEARTLPDARALLLSPPADLEQLFQQMAEKPSAACRAAASLALSDIKEPDGFLENAQQNTEWLDYVSMQETLGVSSFQIADLKTEPCTIFLVIDPNYISEHARFLRLFVRAALGEMARGGETGRQCLFILDEFFSLGKMEYLEKSAGLLRKNGVQLWPILQDLEQLIVLYGPHGSKTFFSNADAHIFFGNEQDKSSLDLIAARIGNFELVDLPDADDLSDRPVEPVAGFWDTADQRASAWDSYMTQREIYDKWNERYKAEHRRVVSAHVGRPRLPPEKIAALIGKGEGDTVARSMIVFASGGRVFNLKLAPYFLPPPPPPELKDAPRPPPGSVTPPFPQEGFSWKERFINILSIFFLVLVAFNIVRILLK